MQAALDPMSHVVKSRGRALANARRIVAVAAAAREPRDHGRARQTLAIDDLLIGPRPQPGNECLNLVPRGEPMQLLAPSARGHRNYLVDRRMKCDQRRER